MGGQGEGEGEGEVGVALAEDALPLLSGIAGGEKGG